MRNVLTPSTATVLSETSDETCRMLWSAAGSKIRVMETSRNSVGRYTRPLLDVAFFALG